MDKKINKDKTCMFFVSDYHFEMISLPYINENLKNNKKIVVITENDLEDTIDELLDKVNLKENEKNEIRKINWKKSVKEDFIDLKCNDNMVVFIKGNKDYISEVSEKIDLNNDMEVIDCYDINDMQSGINDIVDNYKFVLSTAGVKKIN